MNKYLKVALKMVITVSVPLWIVPAIFVAPFFLLYLTVSEIWDEADGTKEPGHF